MVVCVAASATIGQSLPEDVFKTKIQACDCALELDQLHKKILDFFQTRVRYIAPNLSAAVGNAVAAKLMGAVGGLSKLSIMPACSVLLLGGAKRENMTGFSRKNTTGFLHETEIMHSTPPALWSCASRLVAAKSTLAALVDSIKGDPTGETGRLFLEEIRKKIDKWQELPHPRQVKNALPVPGSDNPKKKKRGGRRHRKWKEKYASTKLMKMANRMQFGIPEEEGYGMMFGLSKLAEFANKFEKKHYGSSNGTTTSGLNSSFAFSHAQSINLSNPQVHANQIINGTKSTYFSEVGTFSFVNRN